MSLFITLHFDHAAYEESKAITAVFKFGSMQPVQQLGQTALKGLLVTCLASTGQHPSIVDEIVHSLSCWQGSHLLGCCLQKVQARGQHKLALYYIYIYMYIYIYIYAYRAAEKTL